VTDDLDLLLSQGNPIRTLADAVAYGVKQLEKVGNRTPRRDAEQLLLHITKLSRTDLLIRGDHPLSNHQLLQFEQLLTRRKQSEPIQYILGEREFYGLRFTVTPDVLIPRPETEHLVEAALERIPIDQPFQVADIGTGSGAIAIAIAVARPLASLTAIDLSPAALEIAKENAAHHKVADRIRFRQSDLLEGVGEESFDMIVSNPPYIADADRESLDPEVRKYEPPSALFAGPTGLEIYERLIPQAAKSLHSSGWLLLEIGAGQQLQLQQLLIDWNQVSFLADLQGIPRVAVAQRR
jgi:release factor glutamine methyltransferase